MFHRIGRFRKPNAPFPERHPVFSHNVVPHQLREAIGIRFEALPAEWSTPVNELPVLLQLSQLDVEVTRNEETYSLRFAFPLSEFVELLR